MEKCNCSNLHNGSIISLNDESHCRVCGKDYGFKKSKIEIINFRGFKRVYMVDVCEGEGTPESPRRIVHYIYDDNADQMIGKIDSFKDSLHGSNQN